MRFLKIIIKVGLVLFILVVFCNVLIVLQTDKRNYYTLENLPPNDVGLVLGTSRYLAEGGENLYFSHRITAATLLYSKGKVKRLILSGNNDSPYYNEPQEMKKALIAKGIPEEVLLLDYAGYRTYDSIIRSKAYFKQNSITIISQPFHNARALFLAKHYGINAVAYAAQDVPLFYSIKTMFREYLARPKAIIDLFFVAPQVRVQNKEVK